VVREARDGVELALVHRPKYDDWSLPKGKLDEGEEWEEAALREVAEETGQICELGPELEPVRYTDRKGRDKMVRYFLMRPVSGEFEPTDEVDELRWLRPADAAEALSYEHDRSLVGALGAEGLLWALRHDRTDVQD
jgi:ADP-ribose pyrophosphatase YjhB (NUDIX family)